MLLGVGPCIQRWCTWAAIRLSSTATSPPVFPRPITKTRLSRKHSGNLYSWLWRMWPLNLWIPKGKEGSGNQKFRSVQAECLWAKGSPRNLSALCPRRLITGSGTRRASSSPFGCCEPSYGFGITCFVKKIRWIYIPYEHSLLKQCLREIKFTADNKKCLMHEAPDHLRKEVDAWCVSFYPVVL